MRRMFVFSLLIGAALVSFGLGTVSAAGTYTDTLRRFSFTVPDGYRQTIADRMEVEYEAVNLKDATFAVIIGASTPKETLDQAVSGFVDILSDDTTTIRVDPDKTVTLGGTPARRITLTGADDTGQFQGTLVLALRGNYVYIVFFAAHEEDFAAFSEQTRVVLTSFTFLEGADTPAMTTTTPAATRPPTTPTAATPTASVAPTVTAQPVTSTPSAAAPRRLGDG